MCCLCSFLWPLLAAAHSLADLKKKVFWCLSLIINLINMDQTRLEAAFRGTVLTIYGNGGKKREVGDCFCVFRTSRMCFHTGPSCWRWICEGILCVKYRSTESYWQQSATAWVKYDSLCAPNLKISAINIIIFSYKSSLSINILYF